jgi:hypothetical protein
MDQGAVGVSNEMPSSPDETPDQLEHDIERIRHNLDGLVNELDHRGRALLDWPRQLRRHAVALTAGGLVIAGLVAGGLVIRRQRRRALSARLHRLREAAGRVLVSPERVAPPPQKGAATKIGSALLAAVLSAAVKRSLAARP